MKVNGSIPLKERILGGLWGSLVGDALGVPVEFKDRATVQANPVTDMREYGTHHQPRGTWSDDGAMILCTIDSLLNHEFNLNDMGGRFVRWMQDGLWTANGDVFDIGGTTTSALMRIARGTPPDVAGGRSEESNGNGSLMRILPVVLRFAAEPIESFANHISKVSSVTHGHARSQMACVFYGLTIRKLMLGWKPGPALDSARVEFTGLYERSVEFVRFQHVLEDNFHSLPESMLVSTGYVLHTLHASLWCLLTTQNFREGTLKAVNLGSDSDTTGCVTGGLAGVVYGLNGIPAEWTVALSRRQELEDLFGRFAEVCARANAEAPK